MRISICAYDAPNNIDGPTTWLKRLLPYLRKNGIETRILFIANNVKDLPTLRYFKELNFECKLIPAELFFEEQIKLILEDISLNPPDVFIPNYFPIAAYANRWVKQAGIPSIIVLHNDDEKHHLLVDEFVSGEDDYKVTAVVPVSKLLADMIYNKKHNSVLIERIPCGAPVPDTTSQFNKNGNLKLVYLGRLNDHQKRITDVAKAFCRVTKEVQGTEAIIYGSGSKLQEVLSIIEQEGEDGRVSYGGVLNSSDVQKHLFQNHVFVLLSNFEGIPIALMEAMACGLVPICSNIGSGIAELIVHDKNGFIVNDRSDSLVQAVKLLRCNPSKWQELSNQARNVIKESYSEEVCNHHWKALITKLANSNKYKGKVKVPSIKELKQIPVKNEFLLTDTRRPHLFVLPLFRLKKIIGSFKRNYFN